jgi:hypothetical protein
MGAPRAVRIPRASSAPGTDPGPVMEGKSPVGSRSEAARVANRAGTQRVVRLTAIYLLVLAVLYFGFELYARSVPGNTGPAATTEFLEFTLVAVVLGIVGAVLTLSPAPRAVVRTSKGFAVVGRWGRVVEWGPPESVTVRRVRRYPAGFFSERPVESLEVSGSGRRVRSYLLESGLLSESSPDRGGA